jgi:hypothetical protein
MGRRADPENQASKGSDSAELPQGILTFLLTDIGVHAAVGAPRCFHGCRPGPASGVDRSDGRGL